MRYGLAIAIGGLVAVGSTARAQLSELYPGELSTPSAIAERLNMTNGSTGVSVGGVSINQLAGDAANPLYRIALDPGTRVTGLDWTLFIEASSPALISDLRLAIYGMDSSGDPTGGVLIGPGENIAFSGNFRAEDEWLGLSNNDGFIDLVSLGLDFAPGSDDAVYLEFFSQYPGDTITLGAESSINLLTTTVPAPGSIAVLGGLGLMSTRRRRRG